MEGFLQGHANKKLMEMFHLMLDRLGPQGWWPGDTALEIMVGAVLTQNTNWSNVEKAISNLKKSDLLTIEALYTISVEGLAEKIRPAGYYNIKAGRLKNLINYLFENHAKNAYSNDATPGTRPAYKKARPGQNRKTVYLEFLSL